VVVTEGATTTVPFNDVSVTPSPKVFNVLFPCVTWHSVTREQLNCRLDVSGTTIDVGLAVSEGLQTGQSGPVHTGGGG
jgi:hypothetical protein